MNKNVLIPILLIGGGFLIFMMTRRQVPTYTVPITGNVQRDNTVTNILAVIAQTTASLPVITKLLQQINSMSDSQVQQYAQQVTAGTTQYYPDGTPIIV